MSEELTDIDPQDEVLTSYLDGELSTPERIEVEQRLAADEAFRERLRTLQQAWDALDLLPRASVGDVFTTTTMSMVASELKAQTQLAETTVKQRSSFRMLALVAGTIAATVIGFAVMQYQMQSPNRELVRDLPVIERVEELHSIPSLEFLEKLQKEGLFAGETNESS